jgi:uncharacterized protein YhhL (DUF1145 family)
MNTTIVRIAKITCLVVYLLGLLDALAPELLSLPYEAARAACLLLGIHALELIVFFKRVRWYRGSLGVSMVLTLLFGLLHWKTLQAPDAQAHV